MLQGVTFILRKEKIILCTSNALFGLTHTIRAPTYQKLQPILKNTSRKRFLFLYTCFSVFDTPLDMVGLERKRFFLNPRF